MSLSRALSSVPASRAAQADYDGPWRGAIFVTRETVFTIPYSIMDAVEFPLWGNDLRKLHKLILRPLAEGKFDGGPSRLAIQKAARALQKALASGDHDLYDT